MIEISAVPRGVEQAETRVETVHYYREQEEMDEPRDLDMERAEVVNWSKWTRDVALF